MFVMDIDANYNCTSCAQITFVTGHNIPERVNLVCFYYWATTKLISPLYWRLWNIRLDRLDQNIKSLDFCLCTSYKVFLHSFDDQIPNDYCICLLKLVNGVSNVTLQLQYFIVMQKWRQIYILWPLYRINITLQYCIIVTARPLGA